MRKLTIKRTKTFVACLAKANVYIEDENNCDLVINDTPCRKLGTLKNGEEKTFEISEAAATVFVIADKLSKGFCNEFIRIPAGEEEVTLTGRNRFNLATGNAFRFDGEVSDEVIANRRQSNRKGAVVMVIAAVIGFVLGYVFTSGVLGDGLEGKAKNFSATGMTITLNDKFKTRSYDGFELVCESRKVVVFALREKFSGYPAMKEWTLQEYAEAANASTNAPIQHKDGLIFFEYDATNGTEYHYVAFVYKTGDAFWLVQFATDKSDAEECRPYILEWAKTVQFDKTY